MGAQQPAVLGFLPSYCTARSQAPCCMPYAHPGAWRGVVGRVPISPPLHPAFLTRRCQTKGSGAQAELWQSQAPQLKSCPPQLPSPQAQFLPGVSLSPQHTVVPAQLWVPLTALAWAPRSALAVRAPGCFPLQFCSCGCPALLFLFLLLLLLLLLLPPVLCPQGKSPPQQGCAAAAGHTARDQEVHGPQRAGLQPSGYSKALGDGCPWSRTEAPALFPAVAFPCPTKAHSLSSADFTATEERPTVSDPVVCRRGFTEQTEAVVLTAWLAGTGARRAGGRSCWTSLLGACAREALLALADVD